uniref:Saposin B-type domain-containing protein n=1 Tax=Pristionchus pacificus TaxID=54126 RepID=A0A8R1YEB6_PRIPA
MRSLLVALALVACTLAYKDEMLSSNRIPEHNQEAFGNTCGECKSVIHSFVSAMDDPAKLAELKILLNALCHQTSYETECTLIVKNIDKIVHKLEPFLRDEEAVCKKMRLCQNPKLTNFHRIGLLYLKSAMDRVEGKDATNDFVCDECQLAAIEFKKAVDDVNERAAIKAFISEKVCKHIPKYSGACDLMLEEFLPELWQSLDALLANPKVACAQIGFCAKQAALPLNKVSSKQTLSSFWKKSKHMTTHSGDQILMSCFECKVLIDALSFDLEEPEHFNAIADLLRDWACPQMPPHLYDGCIDFLNMYAPTVVYMTAAQLDAEGICTKNLHMCDATSMMFLRKMGKAEVETKKCDACKAFNAFLKYEITQPDFITDLVAAVNGHVCSNLRDFSALCENFSTSYLPVFVKRVTRLLESGSVCTKIAQVC